MKNQLDKIITDIEKKLSKQFKNNQETVLEERLKIYNKIITQYKSKIDINLILRILNKSFDCKVLYNGKIDKCLFRKWDKELDLVEVTTKSIKVPEEYQQVENQFQKLFNTPQPEQRTPEWYKFRYNRITASDIATALDENPYEPVEGFISKKCDPNFPFYDNKHVFHGKKYEPIATMIYEHIYNNKVTEFGCLPSDKVTFLGASPDGICSKSTLDNKFSNLVGRMLEIKCPTTREIKTKGLTDGGICPHYYYCQVQVQLECCDLEHCDFWQCQLIEYENRNDWLLDTKYSDKHTIGNNAEKITVEKLIQKGCILQFLPKKFEPEFDGDLHVWKSKYIYPHTLMLDNDDYDKWVLDNISNFKELYPELNKDYYFDRVIYWKMKKSHNVVIARDRTWFKKSLPLLQKSWSMILKCRKSKKELEKNNEIYEERAALKKKRWKYYSLDTSINNKSKYYVEKSILFLENINSVPDDVIDCDFID